MSLPNQHDFDAAGVEAMLMAAGLELPRRLMIHG